MAATQVASSALKFSNFQGLRVGSSKNSDSGVESLRLAPHGVEERSSSGAIQAVATPVRPPTSMPAKRSKVEIFKEESNFLRYPLLDDLKTPEANVSAASEQLIKFHGSYQQENREDRKGGGGRSWQFMMRTKQPGGKVSNQLYKVMDDLANEYGNGTLRLTTRQTFQLHGILKHDMKTVFSSVIRNMGSTLGACGDLNRNVLAPVVPFTDRPEYNLCQEYADKIADLLAPQAGAYYDVWMDGEKVISSEEAPDVTAARLDNRNGTIFEDSPEPIYGLQFLPRKFKVAITVPGDNSVDLLTNDVGLVVMCDAKGALQGFNIYVGGGMGRSHRNDSTFPLVAEPFGYCAAADILIVMKAIVATQRDYGRRDDRKQARMKYLVHDWGIPKFRSVVEQYYGKELEAFKELPPWEFKLYAGWGKQGDGKLYYGLHIENGRLKGDAKKAIREVIEKYNLPVRISANQNLMLCDIKPAWRTKITQTLAPVGILGPKYVDRLNLTAMACPALPLCGLAIAEAERGLPDVLKTIRSIMEKVGLQKASDTMVIRMTGCPNGCARPYMAELGFVGDGPNSYQLWLSGCPNQTRLASLFLEHVKLADFPATLEPLFHMWKVQGKKGEAFGDFSDRVGFESLKQYMGDYMLSRASLKKGKNGTATSRIIVDSELKERLRTKARETGIPMTQLAAEALRSYLKLEELSQV